MSNEKMNDLKKAMKEKEESELSSKMERNDIQLELWDEEKIPFYSQDLIERKSVFLPNTSRATSFEVARNNAVKITIGKAGGHKDYGILKTKHRDVLYAVLAIWASHNWPTWKNKDGEYLGHIRTSRYKILNLILQKNPGSNDYKSLMDTLYELKVIPIEVEDIQSEDTKEVFSLFSSFDFETEKEKDVISIYLHPKITKQYYRKQDLKLLFFDTYRNLSSDIAKTLYPIIDRAMAASNEFSKKVVDLCHENGLTAYSYNSEYRKKWKKAFVELNQITLTNGKKIEVSFYENKLKELILLVVSI
ncbi:MAG: hypothetical protein RBT69_13720 [Spirochaetia bacterium]|jgi:hypothetical protein|nr:hypothetical protein [Spirochaetia bacterium]